MKIFILIFIYYLLFITNSFSQWVWQNPLPQGNDLNSVKFLNENTGWAVGKKGTIIKSTDGGNNWIICQSGTIKDLRTVYFIDANTGFALSDTGSIFRTSNGGVNWTHTILNGNYEFNGIYFLNQSTGFISGFNFTTYRGIIFKTTNGGINYVNIYNTTGSDHINTIQFLNNNVGYAGAYGLFYHTTNSGENWSLWQYWDGWDFYFLDTLNAILVCKDKSIYKTTKGGINLKNTYQSQNSFFFSISTKNSNIAYVVGQNGNVLKTTNFGNNWVIQSSGTVLELKSVFFIDSLKGWTVGSNGIILKTTNGGINWQSLSNGQLTNYSSCSFVNSNTGWISGYNSIIKTTNGGNNWIEKLDSSGHNLELINFINENTGWGCPLMQNTENVSIYKTNNGGNNWFCTGVLNIFLGGLHLYEVDIYKIQFVNESIGWICGTQSVWYPQLGSWNMGLLYKTTNGGINWNSSTSLKENYINKKNENKITYLHNYSPNSIVSYFFDVKFINQNTGWLVGSENSIFKTTNSGLNWIQIQGAYVSGMTYTNVSPVNDNIVYLLSYYGNFNLRNNAYISKSTNGGINWITQLIYNGKGFYSLKFINENTGWISGENGLVFATSNGGLNWHYQITPANITLYNIFFTDEQTGWATGDKGTIIKTTSGVQSKLKEITIIIPESFKLFQNYPNPFNPTTNIKYQIIKNGMIALKIYDILGRNIKTLVNEKQNAGTYEVTFDGTGLLSGIYFYRIQVGNLDNSKQIYSETKKMILLK